MLAKLNYILCDRIALDTESVIESFGLGRYRHKIHICSFSYMDKDVFRAVAPLKERQNVVGYIGRFSEEKGVINLARAIPLILTKRDEIEFIMIGDGPLFDQVVNELKSSKSDSRVTLTGTISNEAVPDFLNRMKLLVIPSSYEALPKVALEAMTCGTPVLATSVGSIPDLIKDGEAGFILEDNSPECIARNIIKALENPKLYAVAENAHNLARNRLTYEPVVNEWGDILSELARERTA